ncbi:MAG: mismatch repair protein MutL [Planctomycetota bacterium]|jgi:DNA mismatch repair protein MutL
MARIQQLDTHVVNRIAAGEVIERPGSVIKELLENSVDALSTRIDVDIQAGGLELIRVADNGEGIHPDDMLLAVSSHATSKIRSDADLDHVSTLGFRGEALASIASVAQFRIRTRPEDVPVGRELESHGGRIITDRECGCPPGTVMEVHNLFFNTPARRRFLKKASTEFSHIIEQFSRVALANPRLHMVLRHNDKLVYELPAASDPLDRIRRFFGAEVADHLIPVSSESPLPDGTTIRLWGYVGEPALSRATRSHQFLFLNGRWIQDRSLQHALSEAYRGLLMVGRHPVCFLFLELPPALVDVNVHPNKSEVRFQDGQTLYRQLLKTLRDKFQLLAFQSGIELPTPNPTNVAAPSDTPAAATAELRFDRPQTPNRSHQSLNFNSPPAQPQFPRNSPNPGEPARSSFNDSAVFHHPGVIKALAVDHPPTTTTTQHQQPASAAPILVAESQILTDEFRAFQIHDCYIVVASDAGIEIIDQHALHERIMYESLRQRILAGQVESQRLLIPETIECTPVEAAAVLEATDLFSEMGFDIQDFGGTTLLVNSCPVLIPRGGLVRIIRDFAEKLVQADGKMARRDLLDSMLHTMSCRAAIKAGQRLTIEEMRDLLRQRHIVNDSHHCPHGRPTSLTISRHSLDQQFGRLG